MGKAKAKGKEVTEGSEAAPLGTRQEQFEAAVSRLRTQYGEDAVVTLGDDNTDKRIRQVDVIPTWILAVDRATMVGGIPRGRVTEIIGPEMSGKTTLCLHIISEAQKMGGVAVMFDLENSLVKDHINSVGVKHLDIFQPDTAEDALQMIEDLAKSGSVDVIVVDSVSALSPRGEQEKEIGNTQPGRQAALMSEALRRLIGVLRKTNCAVIFINQIRCLPKTYLTVCDGSLSRIGSISVGKRIVSSRNEVNKVGELVVTEVE